MTSTLYYEAGFTVNTSALSMTASVASATATIGAGTYAHQSLASAMGTGKYTEFAAAVKTAFDSATSSTFTVTYSASTHLYTISRATTFTLDFSGGAAATRLAHALGFTSTSHTGANAYTSDVRPYYVMVPTELARSASLPFVYEPNDIVEEAVSDGGTSYAVAKNTTELWADWTQTMEAKAACFDLYAAASAPWTWQAFFKHVRGQHPIGVYESALYNGVYKLRADSAFFKAVPVTPDWDAIYNIKFTTRFLDTIDPPTAPTIYGAVTVGGTLTISPGSGGGSVTSFAEYLDGVASGRTVAATGSAVSYTVVAADVGTTTFPVITFRAVGPKGTSGDSNAATNPGSSLHTFVSAKSGAWWAGEAGITLTSSAVSAWLDRVAGQTLTDGGTSTRRPAYSSPSLTFDGTSDYLSGAADILSGAGQNTLLVFGAMTAPATYSSPLSYGAGTVLEDLMYDFADGTGTLFSSTITDGSGHLNVACSGIAPTTLDVWSGVFDWSVASPTKALYQNGRGTLINNRALNPSVTGTPPSGSLYVGARPTGTFLQAMTITDVIVVPSELTQTEIAQWSALLRQYRGLSQCLLASQVSDSATAVSGRLGFDVVSEYAVWEGDSTLRVGDTVSIIDYCSLTAAGYCGVGVQENGGAITSLGATDTTGGTFTRRSHDYVITVNNPTLRLTGGIQAYQVTKPNDGTYLAEILLPAGRTFTPTTQTATRRLVACVDSIGSGQTSTDIITAGLAAYLRANYPGRVTFLGAGSYGYAPGATDYSTFGAMGTAFAALCNASGTNEALIQIGTNDLVLWAGSYANMAALRADMALFWAAFRAATATPAWMQTLGDRTNGVPSALGTVADMRTAQIGAVSDSGAANVTTIAGASMYSLTGSADNLHPSAAQQALYGPALRAAMGTW